MGMAMSVTAPRELHLFDLPPPVLVSVIESLPFKDVFCFVDLIMLSNAEGKRLWHGQIKRLLRCPDLDNRMYSEESLWWVLEREITIKNFTTREIKEGKTELHHACMDEGKGWIAEACVVCNDDDINKPDEDGMTPLHHACRLARISVVKLLMESGAEDSLNDKDRRGYIPMDYAITEGRRNVVKLLLDYLSCHEKYISLDNLKNVFLETANWKDREVTKLILGMSAPDIIHSRDSRGSTALHRSCTPLFNIEFLKLLLESGADVDAKDKNGCTPLIDTVTWLTTSIECVKFLLAAGAAVNIRDRRGRTALDYAQDRADRSVQVSAAKMVETLKAAGGLRAAQLP